MTETFSCIYKKDLLFMEEYKDIDIEIIDCEISIPSSPTSVDAEVSIPISFVNMGVQSISRNGEALPIDDKGNVDIPVPTKVSELENDSNYATVGQLSSGIDEAKEYTDNAVSDKVTADEFAVLEETVSMKADKSEIPTKVSELENDSNYVDDEQLGETKLEILGTVDTAKGEAIQESRDYTDTEISKVEEIVNGIADDVEAINGLIPNQATADNQLADKEFVNSSISTNTATFRGTFNSVQQFPQTATNNDYVFLQVVNQTTQLVDRYDRYKWSNGWQFEYSLNNSSFTAAQWAAISSGATVDKINSIVTRSEIETIIDNKLMEVEDGDY